MKYIELRRIDGVATTNLPEKERIIIHSPDGYEWGYMGSGPSDLSLNILYMLKGKSFAEYHYYDFKREIISKVPYDGITLLVEDIEKWCDSR